MAAIVGAISISRGSHTRLWGEKGKGRERVERILLALISTVIFFGIPGPRIKNGTRMSVSYLCASKTKKYKNNKIRK